VADNVDMTFELCPYCEEPVEVTYFPGGWFRVACDACGAQWEVHSGMVRRIADGELLSADAKASDDQQEEELPSRDGVPSTS
jgi:hypothetical protein